MLAELVSERCGKAKNVADLFCGVGPFALRLADKARVAAYRQRARRHRRAAKGGRHAGAEADDS